MSQVNDIEWFNTDKEIEFALDEISGLTSGQKSDLVGAIDALSFARTETYFPQLPPGVMGFLLPKTRIVIKGPPFLYALFKTIFGALVVNGDDSFAAFSLALAAVGDAIGDLKSSFHLLEVNNGEACSYSGIYGESWELYRSLRVRSIRPKKVWRAHEKTRSSCEIEKCKFHKKGCTLKRQ
jgi:hypothetical protein